ncbi:lipid asymmetry ABC transporter MlaABCDEF, periplasmic component MlaC [Campylobacter vicugnae]|uniref:Lipid asymmetry ABC transporter MlaABCDEF, periplasmic component MlaC n=1 Tax=Campylobacter vicugnae TaxID=1660076 RepID=A0A1X9T2Z9_9BACT|nr:ABC transporter substrate-binding protein [Campylobacter sp. RM8964]ARR02769.1 lipid asymmetry ABC transporter MlaABCDEF, periplasmic component MlaC [Campylobacter sp. RM8964]
MRKVFILLFLICSISFGIELKSIDDTLKSDFKKALNIMADSKISKEQKPLELFKLFDAYFDYSLMARLSLSKLYKTLNKAEQDEFIKLFVANLKTSFTQKLGYYSDQEIEFVKGELTNKNRYNVHAIIKNKSENYSLIFKFHPANGSNYLIYDVDILGVSIIQSYRSQFSDLSQSAGFNEITKRLQSVSLDNNTTTK